MIRIFIESGVSDATKKSKEITSEQEFVIRFVEHHFPNNVYKKDFEVIGIGGYTKLEKSKPIFEDVKPGDKNLVIFDADGVNNGGGFAKRQAYLLDEMNRLNLSFELFLWPNNHDDGDFESLLLGMINPQHQGVLDCFDGFVQCVGGRDPNGSLYELPDRKAEMYTYIEIMKLSKDEEDKLHKGYFLFDNASFWNLDSPVADNLKDFLALFLW